MSELIFWTCVGLLGLAFGGYTLVILAISLFVRRPLIREDIVPAVTFLITAYNEERDLSRKLAQTLALDYPRDKLQILVASDGSTDCTDDIVRSFADEGVELVRVEGRVGKTATQNEAVRHARGDIIVFSDATTRYHPQAIRRLVRNYADPAVGAVSGRYEYYNPSKAAIGLGTILFWKYENLIKRLQTRIWTITGCCGCIYSVRRSLYVPLPREIISDLCEPLKIVERGYRIVFEPEAIAYEETTAKIKEEFAMRVRVISRGMHGLLYMRALLNPLRYPFVSFQLLSHKVLRWAVPLILIVMILANAFLLGRPFYDLTFLMTAVFVAIGSTCLLGERLGALPKLMGLPVYFLTVNAASLAALFRVLRGVRATTWETVRR